MHFTCFIYFPFEIQESTYILPRFHFLWDGYLMLVVIESFCCIPRLSPISFVLRILIMGCFFLK